MSHELDIETLTRPGGMVAVDIHTTAELVRHVLRLRTAHEEIIRKYEKIMGNPPEWTDFKPDDPRLKFAREAWFGAAQISRKAIESNSIKGARECGST